MVFVYIVHMVQYIACPHQWTVTGFCTVSSTSITMIIHYHVLMYHVAHIRECEFLYNTTHRIADKRKLLNIGSLSYCVNVGNILRVDKCAYSSFGRSGRLIAPWGTLLLVCHADVVHWSGWESWPATKYVC